MTLVDTVRGELVRAKELKSQYESIGPAGAFGLLSINGAIERADKALTSMDAVDMVRVCKELQGLE